MKLARTTKRKHLSHWVCRIVADLASSDYKPELEKLAAERDAAKENLKQESLSRLMKDMAVSGGQTSDSKVPDAYAHQTLASRDQDEDEVSEIDDDSDNIIDRADMLPARGDNQERAFTSRKPVKPIRSRGVYEDGEFVLEQITSFNLLDCLRTEQGGRWPAP